MIHNIHRINPKNCGDMNCSPLKYFNFPLETNEICIEKLCLFPKQFNLQGHIIMGGGGLFYEPWLNTIKQFPQAILWGVGLNLHGKGKQGTYPDFIKNFPLVGTRDFNEHRWVPCVTCMDNLFDTTSSPSHEVIVYEHLECPIDSPKELPKLNNSVNMDEAIHFLSSGECVVTNTYHGAYWATLLNKKVIVIPLENSSRFFFFKHPPLIMNQFPKKIPTIQTYSESLGECREANVEFHKDALGLLYGRMI